MTEDTADEHPNLRRGRFTALARDELVEPLRRFLLRRTDPGTADAVLSETLLVCWRRFDEVPDPPLPWTYAVARAVLADARRSEERAPRVAPLAPVRDDLEDGGPRDAVHVLLAELDEEDAEVLRLWGWEQLGPAEIATVLGMTPDAVGVRLGRARTRFAEGLGRIEAGAGREGSTGGGP